MAKTVREALTEYDEAVRRDAMKADFERYTGIKLGDALRWCTGRWPSFLVEDGKQ